MIRRSTAVVLVIFLILVFATLYLQRKNNVEITGETITSTPVAYLFDLTSESLSKVQIEKTGDSQLSMQKDEQGIWSFIEPAGYEIDQDEAQSIADMILSLNVLTRLETSTSLEVLGLDKPSYRIILTTNDGEELITIIGNITTTSSGYYVSKMGHIPVLISKPSLDAIFNKIETPPIFVTQTPSATPLITETQIPESTQTP